MSPLTWVTLGWRDMVRCGWVSYLHGLLFALFGILTFILAHNRFWLLAGALSGLLIIAPILATSLYALSRALERGEKADFKVVTYTWTQWQKSHTNKLGDDYWCLIRLGILLALAATGWVITSAAFITLIAQSPVNTPIDFVRNIVLAKQGWGFELWLTLGGIMAAPIFASTVVAVPLLLDRKVNLFEAILISWRAVLDNPLTMAIWASAIMLFIFFGTAFAFVGLIVAIPVLGHASWHAYRDLIDVTSLPAR
ncbi:MAG TPA: DUF2189 domain-containing protein [Burkholderiaceae bacterium]|nr:DUF2189 domain-containing protein [Burkholderiaceae bacterium]